MRGSLSASERHDRKRAEHKRYYTQTAFKYERRKWTDDEDKLVLIQRVPDRELSRIIKRSIYHVDCNNSVEPAHKYHLERKKILRYLAISNYQ